MSTRLLTAAEGPRVRRGSGLAALSAREREVAELVTDRLTNRDIADRLVLSPKTVERHLSRIYETLGIASRVELARLVESASEGARPAALSAASPAAGTPRACGARGRCAPSPCPSS